MNTSFSPLSHGGQEFGGTVSPSQSISRDSSFGESKWYLSSLIFINSREPSDMVINFECRLPDGSLLTDTTNTTLYISTKELLYWRFQGLPSIKPVKATTVKNEFRLLKVLIFWMIRVGKNTYSQIRPHHIEVEFLSFLKGQSEAEEGKNKIWSDEMIVAILACVQRLWSFRDKLSDSLTFNPFRGKRPSKVLGVPRSHYGENRTPIIPDEVMVPLGNAALNYIYIYSKDILNARAQVEAVRADLEGQGKWDYARGRLGNLILGNISGPCPASAALRRVEITNMPGTETPWQEPFKGLLDLYREENALFAACYIVIAWLTGMRSSEIASLRVNCLRRELSEDGVVERFKLTGRVYKGVCAPEGREETWITIEPVARAIDVLIMLTERLRAKATEEEVTALFLRGGRYSTVCVLKDGNTQDLLRHFVNHIKLPLVNGEVWKLCARQFRRTLARWIARRPFGELAGMIQYKHAEIAVFEGYAGRDATFSKELSEEKLLANIDLLEELKRDIIEGQVAGPKGAELIETFRGVVGDRRADDEAYMLKHLARILHVGMFNLCFYDPAYAMCQQHIPAHERKAPIMSHCQPSLCPNSCITKQHLDPRQRVLDEINKLLKTPNLSSPQRIALETERREILHSIEPLSGNGGRV